MPESILSYAQHSARETVNHVVIDLLFKIKKFECYFLRFSLIIKVYFSLYRVLKAVFINVNNIAVFCERPKSAFMLRK